MRNEESGMKYKKYKYRVRNLELEIKNMKYRNKIIPDSRFTD